MLFFIEHLLNALHALQENIKLFGGQATTNASLALQESILVRLQDRVLSAQRGNIPARGQDYALRVGTPRNY